jgi:hypothetical protein
MEATQEGDVSDTPDTTSDAAGKITQADIERAKRQIGIPKFAYNKPYNALASPDALSHFAWACGDMSAHMGLRRGGATRSHFRCSCIPPART